MGRYTESSLLQVTHAAEGMCKWIVFDVSNQKHKLVHAKKDHINGGD